LLRNNYASENTTLIRNQSSYGALEGYFIEDDPGTPLIPQG